MSSLLHFYTNKYHHFITILRWSNEVARGIEIKYWLCQNKIQIHTDCHSYIPWQWITSLHHHFEMLKWSYSSPWNQFFLATILPLQNPNAHISSLLHFKGMHNLTSSSYWDVKMKLFIALKSFFFDTIIPLQTKIQINTCRHSYISIPTNIITS